MHLLEFYLHPKVMRMLEFLEAIILENVNKLKKKKMSRSEVLIVFRAKSDVNSYGDLHEFLRQF